MADRSAIEWTDATWNPIRARNTRTGRVGWHCEHATTGCVFCYAEGFNLRLGTQLPFKPGHLDNGDIELFLDEEMLRQPLRWKKPRMIFVCSMTDLFARFVPDAWLFEIFAVMGACEGQGLGHEFQVLTKRADRMRQWVTEHGHRAWNSARLGPNAWPARNVWLGVSTERQEEADARIPHLIETPASVKFISAEPLIGPIEFRLVPGFNRVNLSLWNWWVIAGGESGRSARPMHPDWARSLRDQCAAAGVRFFFKQWGEFTPTASTLAEFLNKKDERRLGEMIIASEGRFSGYPEHGVTDFDVMRRVGKKAAGRLLDGVEHNGMPKISGEETSHGV